MKKLLSIIIAVLLAACSALPCFAAEEADTRLGVGMSVMGFSSYNVVTGEAVTSSMLGNSVLTVINEWAEWCGPCRAEMPYFQAAYDHFTATPQADVQILGSFYGNSVNAASDFLNSYGYTWPSVFEDNVLAQVFNTSNSIPQTIIVDRNGIVREHIIGSFQSEAALMEFINGWLETLMEEEGGQQLPGDTDGDGALTSVDALTILRMAAGIIPSDPIGDINGDGFVDTADALLVLRMALGLA